ncbi:hypothetical protein Csa_000504 [Cucumis sativus]|uniref:Uncharacterized protein n=1 Tax=Cucumis sativus TaxID=3659 RepID=A0A0A0KNG2_CUCSA|nr:hypothetical protein Csa_000504 [Cucumis sativus]
MTGDCSWMQREHCNSVSTKSGTPHAPHVEMSRRHLIEHLPKLHLHSTDHRHVSIM